MLRVRSTLSGPVRPSAAARGYSSVWESAWIAPRRSPVRARLAPFSGSACGADGSPQSLVEVEHEGRQPVGSLVSVPRPQIPHTREVRVGPTAGERGGGVAFG